MTMHLAALALGAWLDGGPAIADEGKVPPGPEPPCASTEGIEAGPRLAKWIEQRKAKCAELRPYERTWLEGQILAFDKAERPSITEINLLGAYPRIQTIDHRSQYAAGLRLWRPNLGGSRFDLSGAAFVSLAGFQYYDLQAGVIPHQGKGFPLFAAKSDQVFELANVPRNADSPYMLYGAFVHRYAPEYDFFGIGPDSRKEDQADFRQTDSLYEGVAGYRALPRLTLVARAGYYEVSLGPGKDDELPNLEDAFDPATIPGLAENLPDYLRYGASAIFDSRDRPRNPHRGVVLAAEWTRYDQRGGSASSFDRLAADARAYIPLGRWQRVLSLRAYLSRDHPAQEGGRVPFYMLAFLGSSHTLRAFDSQRFRGERLGLLQAEYRWEASPALELAAFVDSGTVAATGDEELGKLETDGGIGLRVKSHEAVMLRFDFAWGDEGFKFLFRFSPSF